MNKTASLLGGCLVYMILGSIALISSYANSIPLTGNELKGLNEADIKQGKLIIEIGTSYPGRINPKTGIPYIEIPVAGEHIIIFGDGDVYSRRGCERDWLDEYFPSCFSIDDTWSSYGDPPKIYTRNCVYKVSIDRIIELLNLVGNHEGELLPGKSYMGDPYFVYVRVVFDGRDGNLLEYIFKTKPNEENIAVIKGIMDRIDEMELEANIEIPDPYDFIVNLNAKKKAFDWFPAKANW